MCIFVHHTSEKVHVSYNSNWFQESILPSVSVIEKRPGDRTVKREVGLAGLEVQGPQKFSSMNRLTARGPH